MTVPTENIPTRARFTTHPEGSQVCDDTWRMGCRCDGCVQAHARWYAAGRYRWPVPPSRASLPAPRPSLKRASDSWPARA